MPSDTAKTETKRKRRQRGSGKARKAALEKAGTTPSFPIHPPKK